MKNNKNLDIISSIQAEKEENQDTKVIHILLI
jgi:hypothetical protein